MATSRGTRIGIWIIAVVMAVGTIGSFAVMMLANDNQKIDEDMSMKAYEEQMKQMAEESAANSESFTSKHKPAKFDGGKVKELKSELLEQGKGKAIKATDTVNVSYTGWTSDGKIFDSSKRKDSEDAPIDLSLGSVIPGWTEGLTGVKAGSTVLLTIPSEKAYGEAGSGTIPANAPLQFVIKVHGITENEVEE